jgi:hypothetical protein
LHCLPAFEFGSRDFRGGARSSLHLPVFAGVYFLLARLIMKKVMAIMEIATKDLQAQRVEKSVREMQNGFKYGRWQVFGKWPTQCPDRHGLLYEKGF